MRQMLHNNRGETLIEVLAAVLITALSVALLFTCIMASARMDDAAQELDAEHYNALSEAEVQTKDPTGTPLPDGTVTISREDSSGTTYSANPAPSIEIYGGDGLYSYKGK